MNPKDLIRDLQFDTDKAKPPEWQPDWEDAPLPFKLYRGLPVFPLPADIPLRLDPIAGTAKRDLRSIGHFLWYAGAIAQVSRSRSVKEAEGFDAGSAEMYRRIVPSGGGLYPNELYVYLKTEELPAGVYHYDAAHHRLVLLRAGSHDAYLNRALGERCRMEERFGAVFVTAMFWKNFFKYHAFSYRLQGLDGGVLIGQLLHAADLFGYPAAVHYQFLDRSLGRLLGLEESQESVYAAIPFGGNPAVYPVRSETARGAPVRSEELQAFIRPVFHEHYIRSKRVKDFSVLLRMNEACMYESTDRFRTATERSRSPRRQGEIRLPPPELPKADLLAVFRKRYTPETDFVWKRVRPARLAGLLQEAVSSLRYANDLDGQPPNPASASVSLYFCSNGVEGLADGAYRYDAESETLELIRAGDHRTWLQYGMTLHNVNLFQVPLVFHIAGDRGHGDREWGPRGYRIQQMEAGILTQRLLAAAARDGMGGRPLLGFEAIMADQLYRLEPAGLTALIQIPVGPYRFRYRWEGSLHR